MNIRKNFDVDHGLALAHPEFFFIYTIGLGVIDIIWPYSRLGLQFADL